MSKVKNLPVYPVDAIDAEAAVSDIQSILRHRNMSTTDLAIELGWKRSRVEDFLFGTDIPSRSDFIEIAKVLDYELDI